VKTHQLNLDEFFDNIKKRAEETKDPRLVKFSNSFSSFFRSRVREEKSMYRTFNVVISAGRGEGKDERDRLGILEQRVQIVMHGLTNVGLIPRRVNDDGIMLLYSSFFSPLSEINSSYLAPITLAEDWKKRWESLREEIRELSKFSRSKVDYSTTASMLSELVAPSYINTRRDYIQINNRFYRTIAVVGYPDLVAPAFLEPLMTMRGAFHISLYLQPTNFSSVLDYYNNVLQKQSIDIATDEAAGKLVPYSTRIQRKGTQQLIEMLTSGSERAFLQSLYVCVESESPEKLDLLTDSVVSKLNEVRLKPQIAYEKMDSGFRSCAPLGCDMLNVSRNMTSSSLAASFPFVSAYLEPQPKGILFGENQLDGMPIICDVFSKSFENANGLVLGMSGSGKSFAVKTVLSRALQQGIGVIVLDPSEEGEYESLTASLGGKIIEFSEKSDAFINPFQITEQSYEEKLFFLHSLMRFFVSELTDDMKDLFDEAFESIYAARGITHEPKTWVREVPTLSDLYSYVEKEKGSSFAKRAEAATAISSSLRRFVKGSYSFINKQTNIKKLEGRFITFKIGHLPREVRRILMFIILEFVFNRMKKDLRKKMLVIDEAWKLLQTESEEGYVLNIVKTCRHHNMGLSLITQDVYDLLTSKAGKAVMANTSWQLLLRMKPSIIDDVASTFKLNETTKNYLLTAEPGSGLFFVNNTFIPLKNIVASEEYKLFTTHPEDREVERYAHQNENL
jgi:energy-coupling factor transporter ATP-binding protein EcfA2